MSYQTRNQVGQYKPIPQPPREPNALIQLLAWSLWVAWRTIVLVRVLAPRYARRLYWASKHLAHYLATDARVAGAVYAGRNVVWMDPHDDTSAIAINHYWACRAE